jgi:hypothetical protein
MGRFWLLMGVRGIWVCNLAGVDLNIPTSYSRMRKSKVSKELRRRSYEVGYATMDVLLTSHVEMKAFDVEMKAFDVEMKAFGSEIRF